MEELGDVAQRLPVLRHGEVVAVLGLEGFHLLRVFEPVLAIGPADGVALERDRPVFAAVAGIFGVIFHRRRRHDLAELVLLEEVGEVDIVAARRRPAPSHWRVTDDHVVGVALGVEFGEGLGLEVGPGRGLDRDLHAGLGLVLVDEFLQVVGRIPFGPEDGEFLRERRRAAGKRESDAGKHAGQCLAHYEFLPCAHLYLLVEAAPDRWSLAAPGSLQCTAWEPPSQPVLNRFRL